MATAWCQRAQLTFPSLIGSATTSITSSHASFPQAPETGPSVSMLGDDEGGIVQGSGRGAYYGAFAGVTPDTCAHRLNLPIVGGQAPAAISISSDSQIGTCDIYIGGISTANRYRLSPRRPIYLPPNSGEVAYVTLPNALPVPLNDLVAIDAVELLGDWGASTQYKVKAWPLRLDIWYGAIPQGETPRAPNIGRMDCLLPTSGTNKAQIVMLSDGRTDGYCICTTTSSSTVYASIYGVAAFPYLTAGSGYLSGRDTNYAMRATPLTSVLVAGEATFLRIPASEMGWPAYCFELLDSTGHDTGRNTLTAYLLD